MITQKWSVRLDESTHEVEYKFSRLSGKTTLIVDGDSFTVGGKFLGIGVARSEPIIVGMTQGVLNIDKRGHAILVVREAVEVKETE